MNKKIINYLLCIVVFFCVLLYLASIEQQRINSEIIANNESFNSFMESSFGMLNNTFEIKAKGTYTKKRIRGYHGDLGYNWIRAYEIRAPFMDRPFEVWVDNRTHKIFGDNFYEVLSKDPKFQHLYSEWVKRQVGIDDENVELNIGCEKIFFENIYKYDSNEDIFVNSSGKISEIRLKNVKVDNDTNFYDIFLLFEEKYLSKFYVNNISCDYKFIIEGEDKKVYFYNEINSYKNQYTNEHYRMRKEYEYIDGHIYQKNDEVLYSMINSINEYTNINIIDFNDKTYKYILYDVLIKKTAPTNLFNLSNEVINYKEFERNPDINIIANDFLLNETNYNDGYILVEKIIELEQGYRIHRYEVELNEIHFNGDGEKLIKCDIHNKVKCIFEDIFDGENNNYIIYQMDESNNWKPVFQKPISPNNKYVEINNFEFKEGTPKYDFFIEIESKMFEYYKNVK